MNLDQLLDQLKTDTDFMSCVTNWEVSPAREARHASWPDGLHPKVLGALAGAGIGKPYTHQAQAIQLAEQGRDVCVVTPTASGKTLCYNVPILNAIMADQDTRALYLFPTKALSQDQVASLYELITSMDVDIKTYTYDGDTPAAARKAIRQAGHVVVTNPDMLHSNILPHHTKWVKLFENLRYIVIDEIHSYRGIFGANLANVLRRLLRLCDFYGSKPQFILCSATIKNPGELAEKLIGRAVDVVDDNGSPAGVRHVIFYNPPVVNRQLGIRKSALSQTRHLAERILRNHIPTIIFAKSRVQVEVLTRYLKELRADPLGRSGTVRGYRGGYLPRERREIEKGLRGGDVDMVITTNALELGIDIGSLEACLLCAYPGTIASTWQQAGRAGRRSGASLTILVASSAPIDQYIISHPEYFFAQSPENALTNPDNLYVLLSHFKCAAYELPFKDGDPFGNAPGTESLLTYLEEASILRHVEGSYYWAAEDFPASEISLRTAMTENFLIMDITDPAHVRMVGEMDRFTVPMLLHENAIYLHEGVQYQVEKLDFDACKAFIKHVDVDYYTDADLNISLSLLDVEESAGNAARGEVKVTALVKIFKKMAFDTGESLGYGPVRLPETDMHTTAMWLTLPEGTSRQYGKDSLQNGMLGISNLLRIVAPLYLMCSPQDLAISYQVKSPFTGLPTLILYDNCPGGIGLSEKAYLMRRTLVRHAKDIVTACECQAGCPSCAGPQNEIGTDGKKTAARLLNDLEALLASAPEV
ncbi:MAG: DEAD/DEAH box helicase [Eubacteriales bacterium]|nr:DEAD/DEAH box helicase [Eubacteriales bacterium]MDD4133751.1 DEAD/DEAH box helicase [Eubacteriales bacterium]